MRPAAAAPPPRAGAPATAGPPPRDHGYDYDLFVIGTGSGGMRATRMARNMFKLPKVGCCDMPFSQLSVEGRSIMSPQTVGGVGGTCVIRGCVPKKYFWYGSHFAHDMRDAKGYGWDVDVKGFNWQTLLRKKREETERLHKFQSEKRLPKAGVEILEGRGRLLDAHRIEVGPPAGKVVTAQTILLACGTTPQAIDIPGKEHAISSDHILEVERCPKKLAIIGAGYIACEFACMFAAWGCETHVIYRKPLPLRGFDADCRAFLARQMELHGVHLHPEHTPVRIEKQGDGRYTAVARAAGGDAAFADCDEVLMATGRAANTQGLGLGAAGVALTAGGSVRVDEHHRTSVGNIYAIGDITDRMQLTPVAIQEAMAFLHTVYGGRPHRLDYETIPSAVFTQPPMGTCGLTEEQAVAKYRDVDVYIDGHEGGFQPMVHTFSGSKEEMMVKIIIASGTERVVGIHLVGKDSAEIIQGFAVAMKCGATKRDLYDTVAVHPSAAEEVVCIPGIDMFPPERRYRGGALATAARL